MVSCEHGSEPLSSREARGFIYLFFFCQLLGETAHSDLENVLLVVEKALSLF
jgi:hypothetical protein